MATQHPNSSIHEWKCSGNGSDNKHAEAINNQFKCQVCDRTYDDYLKENKIETGQRILLSSGMAAIVALLFVIWAGLYVRQKFIEADRVIAHLNDTKAKLAKINAELEQATEQLKRVPELENSLKETQNKLESTTTRLQITESNLEQTQKKLTVTNEQLQKRNQQVANGSQCVKLMRQINNVIWQGAYLAPTEVVTIQQKLQSLGFYQDELDGKFGETTVKAINNFQQTCEIKLSQR